MNDVADSIPEARILTCTEDEYYADPCERPSLSQSIAHKLISESPLHAFTAHPRLGGEKRDDSTKAKDDGTIMHKLLLGAGRDLVPIPHNDFKTNAAKDLRDAALALGKLPVIEHKLHELRKVAEILRGKLKDHGYEFTGVSELSLEWTEQGEKSNILCRGRMDHVFVDRGVIYDVKKISSANPKTCGKHAFEYGYDIQHTAYTRALGKLKPEFLGKVDFVFLFVEMEPPYAVVPARLDGTLRELGAQRWEKALLTWERCLATGHWPEYTDRTINLEAPSWIVNQVMGDANANW